MAEPSSLELWEVTAIGAALAPSAAKAADGQFAVVGQPNTSQPPRSSYTINAPGTGVRQPTMSLANAERARAPPGSGRPEL